MLISNAVKFKIYAILLQDYSAIISGNLQFFNTKINIIRNIEEYMILFYKLYIIFTNVAINII